MNAQEAHARVEEACPGFFDAIEKAVAGTGIDEVADLLIATVDTEAKCRVLGQRLAEFQSSVRVPCAEDLSWLSGNGAPLCVLLARRAEILEARRAAVPQLPAAMEMLSAAIEVGSRMQKYADACRHLLGALYTRAHVAEHHWDDLPLA